MNRFTNGKAQRAATPAAITLAFGNVISAVLHHGLEWDVSPELALSFGIVTMFILNRFMGDDD